MKKFSHRQNNKANKKPYTSFNSKPSLDKYELVVYLNNQWIASQSGPAFFLEENTGIVRSIN